MFWLVAELRKAVDDVIHHLVLGTRVRCTVRQSLLRRFGTVASILWNEVTCTPPRVATAHWPSSPRTFGTIYTMYSGRGSDVLILEFLFCLNSWLEIERNVTITAQVAAQQVHPLDMSRDAECLRMRGYPRMLPK